MVDVHHQRPVRELRTPRTTVDHEAVLPAGEPRPDLVPLLPAEAEQSIAVREGAEGLEAPEEARLFDVRSAVLRAEDVAVAALVAEVLEGPDLVDLLGIEH